jgi:Uma2 family endonuclease
MPATALITSAQFAEMPSRYDASGNLIKEELIAGKIVDGVPPTQQRHDISKNSVAKLLDRFLFQRPELGLTALVEIAFEIAAADVVVPDVSVIEKHRVAPQGSDWIADAPLVAIEIVSPSDTVMVVKRKVTTYLANGARSVWLIYPSDSSVVIHRSGSIRELSGDQLLEDPLLPGFSTPVSAFFDLV